jgi:hypothetical protein
MDILGAELRDYQAGLLQKMDSKEATTACRIWRFIVRPCKPFLLQYAAKTADVCYGQQFISVKQDRGRVLMQFLKAFLHDDDIAPNL